MDNESSQYKKFDFIFKMYSLEVADREIIQSKIKTYIYITLASFVCIYFGIVKFPPILCPQLTSFLVSILLLSHLVAYILIYKIFSLQDYGEIGNVKKSDLTEEIEKFYIECNEELIDSFNKNCKINKKRREYTAVIFKIYYFIGIIHFSWFVFFIIKILLGSKL